MMDDSSFVSKKRRLSNSIIPPSKATTKKSKPSQTPIFCDLDGVLVDFNGAVKKHCGKEADQMPLGRLWAVVARQENFFEYLDWTHDGKELWEAIRHLQPDILTGVPNSKPDQVGAEKAIWCAREFQCPVHHIDKAARKPQQHAVVSGGKPRDGIINVISCWSKFKYRECKIPGAILIDDRVKFAAAWQQAGGVFIHHVNTSTTLEQLRKLGVIDGDASKQAIPTKVSSQAEPTKPMDERFFEDYRPDTP